MFAPSLLTPRFKKEFIQYYARGFDIKTSCDCMGESSAKVTRWRKIGTFETVEEASEYFKGKISKKHHKDCQDFLRETDKARAKGTLTLIEALEKIGLGHMEPITTTTTTTTVMEVLDSYGDKRELTTRKVAVANHSGVKPNPKTLQWLATVRDRKHFDLNRPDTEEESAPTSIVFAPVITEAKAEEDDK